MNILNVLRFTPDFGGGIVKHLKALGAASKDGGHQLSIAFSARRQWQEELKFNSNVIIMREIEDPIRSGFPKVLSSICKNLNIDVVHFHFYFSLPFSLAVSFRRWSVPVIYQWHNPPIPLNDYFTPPDKLKGKVKRLISGFAARWTGYKIINHHIVVSNDIKNLLVSKRWIQLNKVTVIPNCVQLVASSIKSKESNISKIPIIGSVANFRSEKDHETLIRAIKILCDWKIDCELWLVGDGSTRQSMEQLTRELKITDRVRFVGTVMKPSGMYEQFNVFALSTHYEGHPLVVLEAMSYGLPVVATNISSIPEIVIHNVNGLLVNPKDPEDFANALKRLLTDQSLSKRLGETARKTIEKSHTLDQWAEQILSLYEQIVKKN